MNFSGVSGLVRLSNTNYTKEFKLILSVIEKNLSLKEASRRFNICGVQYSYLAA
jgi:transposase